MNTSSPSISELQHDTKLPLAFRLRQPVSPGLRRAVLLLHGVGGNETNLAELALQLPADHLVVLPRGPLSLAATQFAWFSVAFTASGPRINAAEAEHARVMLADFVAALENQYALPRGSTLIAGFSQGGIMSASLALTEAQRVRGFGILSGRILPEIAAQLAARDALQKLRAFISHGDADNVLPVSWAERSEQWLGELGVPFEAHRYAAAHTLTAAMAADFVAWINAQAAA